MNFNNIRIKFDDDILYLDIYENNFLYKYSIETSIKHKIYELNDNSDLINFIYYNNTEFEKDLLNALKDLNKQHLNLLKSNDWYLVYEIDLKNKQKILKLECDRLFEYDI